MLRSVIRSNRFAWMADAELCSAACPLDGRADVRPAGPPSPAEPGPREDRPVIRTLHQDGDGPADPPPRPTLGRRSRAPPSTADNGVAAIPGQSLTVETTPSPSAPARSRRSDASPVGPPSGLSSRVDLRAILASSPWHGAMPAATGTSRPSAAAPRSPTSSHGPIVRPPSRGQRAGLQGSDRWRSVPVATSVVIARLLRRGPKSSD